MQLILDIKEKEKLSSICNSIVKFVDSVQDKYCEDINLDGYVCSCYDEGGCILDREVAECPHYDECCSGTKMVTIKNGAVVVENIQFDGM